MPRTKRVIGLRTAVGAVGLGIASLAVVAAPAGAGSAPKIKVSPDARLAKKATVEVKGKHLPASTAVTIMECSSTEQTEAGCNVAGAVSGMTAATGRLAQTSLPVSSRYTSEGGTVMACTAQAPCAVAVATTTGTKLAAVVISFK
jgi:hypothetical protein